MKIDQKEPEHKAEHKEPKAKEPNNIDKLRALQTRVQQHMVFGAQEGLDLIDAILDELGADPLPAKKVSDPPSADLVDETQMTGEGHEKGAKTATHPHGATETDEDDDVSDVDDDNPPTERGHQQPANVHERTTEQRNIHERPGQTHEKPGTKKEAPPAKKHK